MKSNRNKRGFTLIEILVVVLIIGILAAVALPQYQKAVDKSRFVQIMIAAKSARAMQEQYYLANSTYSTDQTALDIELSDEVRLDLHASCSSSQPASTYMTWTKLPGLLIIDNYARQCSPWNAETTGCYAYNARANAFCANAMNMTKHTEPCNPCIYWKKIF